mmetsp:Transcript_98351/g.249640  ORF Transcript_98351/g.249640 Transcript_98351/m.249640 type:complete len:95 (+) Transcript_98351:38-322(+)|eukprot:CAMPEP_0183398800 /NCGR_PEP_ID=MMETSP0370-20130417/11501_1 /TAXON_ID=268820 /ORGANISM="Peridinium aciculiferum, Strain PAER-2" /LENGTH=94 /DNA_ID=CAMNT_0025579859 /DNA_START=30 /DNA_END=314 /DNA_ORIENTATION=-
MASASSSLPRGYAPPSPSYVPDGPPSKGNQGIWISNRMGDNTSRAWGFSLHSKGHDVAMIQTVRSSTDPLVCWGKVAEAAPPRSGTESRKKPRS